MTAHKKLGIRIVAVVALSIFAVEAAIGYFSLRREKREAVTENAAHMGRLTSILGEDWYRAIGERRFGYLTETLLRICRDSHAHAFVLFEPDGKVLSEAALTPGYKARQADLKEKLRRIGDKPYLLETLSRPEGDVLWFLAPLRDASGRAAAGLSVEWPSSGMGSRLVPLVAEMAGRAFLTAAVVTAIIMAALFYFVAEPIRAMSGELEDLSKGEADLTFQMKVRSQDEIGEMAQWFNSFLGKIRAMVLRVMEHSQRLTEQVGALTHSTNEVLAMSEDVTTTIQQIARGAEEQASKISEVNHLMQEAQDLMKQVERKAQDTAGAAERAAQTAKAGGQLAQGTINKMVELNGIILQNSEMVGRLGTRSREIGKVVEIISGIAEQTNLLSLNAAIEAARAGEQGRGFAVVADEIRTLADGSAKAVQEITGLVQEIQDATGAVVESMEKSAGEAQGSKEVIRQMEGSLSEIVAVIENVASHSRSITELLGQQAQRYAKVVHGIQDINAVSEESAASTEEVSASTEEQSASMEQVSATCREIEAMAVELKSMVEKFKVG